MLTSIRLEDWKSFGRGDSVRNLVALGAVTLLVGPNGSGKSNVLDALRFLQGAALDLPVGDVLRGRWEGQREIWPGIRGHVVEAARAKTHEFALTTTWSGGAEHRLGITTDGDASVTKEMLSDSSGVLFNIASPAIPAAIGDAQGRGFAFNKSPKPGRWEPTTHSSARSLLGQLETAGAVDPRVREVADELRRTIRGIAFLDIRPSLMRDYRPENGGQLGISGENISPVLASIAKDPARAADIVDWIEELVAPEIERLDFDRTQLREVMLFVVEADQRRVSARSMSDGTLRFLGEVVALLTSPEGSLVVMEEPDVGLHPSRTRLLAELFESVASRRGIQILATTHSPTLLAHLSKQTLGNVVAFGRDPASGLSICSRLADLPHFATLRDARDLEHLVSTGWIERAL